MLTRVLLSFRRSPLSHFLFWSETCHSTALKSALWRVYQYQHVRLQCIHLKSCKTSFALNERLLTLTEGTELPFIYSVGFFCSDTVAVWIQQTHLQQKKGYVYVHTKLAKATTKHTHSACVYLVLRDCLMPETDVALVIWTSLWWLSGDCNVGKMYLKNIPKCTKVFNITWGNNRFDVVVSMNLSQRYLRKMAR